MKSRATRNIQIEKQTRRILSKAAATHDAASSKTKKRMAAKKSLAKKATKRVPT